MQQIKKIPFLFCSVSSFKSIILSMKLINISVSKKDGGTLFASLITGFFLKYTQNFDKIQTYFDK